MSDKRLYRSSVNYMLAGDAEELPSILILTPHL